MSNSLNLSLPYVAASQAQKHVTVNEAFRLLDSIVQLGVQARGNNTPPDSPSEGDRYICGNNPTGAWLGRPLNVAAFVDGAWAFFAPSAGWTAYVVAEGTLVYFDGAAWRIMVALDSTEIMSRLGINTSADEANRLKVAAQSVLFEPDTTGASPSGDVRLNVTKESAGDVAAIHFQTNFQTRAELGLLASNNFSIKVSDDDGAFQTVLSANRNDGTIDMVSPPTVRGVNAIEYVFPSRVDLVNAAVPSSIETVRTRGYYADGDGGGGCYRRSGTLPDDDLGVQDAAGGFWRLDADQVDVRQAGAVGDGVTNDTAALATAFSSSRNVFISKGRYLVTGRLATSADHQRITGAGRGVAVFAVPKSFDIGADAVVRINNTFVTLQDFSVEFDQSGATQRDQLIAYPPALNLRGMPRCRLRCLRLEGAFVGVDARDNCGGAIFDDLECGAFDEGFQFGGSLDTVEMRNCRVWPYGVVSDPALFAIFRDGNTIGFRIGRIDDLNMSGCTTFEARILVETTEVTTASGPVVAGPFGSVTDLALDGKFSRLEMSGGDLQIAGVYATTGVPDDFLFDVRGEAKLVVSAFSLTPASLAQPAVVVRNSADVTFTGGVVDIDGGIAVDVFVVRDEAKLTVSGTSFKLRGDLNRAGACIRQAGASVLTAYGNTSSRRTTGSGNMIEVTADQPHAIFGNNAAGWGYFFPATQSQGLYGPNK